MKKNKFKLINNERKLIDCKNDITEYENFIYFLLKQNVYN